MATLAMATHALGNTKARAFQLTVNNLQVLDDVFAYLNSLQTKDYIIAAKEVAPTTGHEHVHIYVHFRTPIRLSVKKCAGAHIEICRGTPQQNIAYIMKDGDVILESGDRPQQGGIRVQDLEQTHDPSMLPWQMYNTWQKLHARPTKVKVAEWHKEVKVIYIQGPSGAGKSLKAHDIMVEDGVDEFEEVKHIGEFWHGVVDGRGYAVYDDFRDSHVKASEFINFIDYNVHSLNVKGGSVKNNYTKIIITSVQRLGEIYGNMHGEAREQWMRRVELIDLYDDM